MKGNWKAQMFSEYTAQDRKLVPKDNDSLNPCSGCAYYKHSSCTYPGQFPFCTQKKNHIFK